MPAVADAVRKVLVRRPPYTHTIELETGTGFKTIIRPNWWLLGTKMTVRLKPSSRGTQVIIDTKSQRLIMGDIYGYYNRYINEFMRELKKLVE